ncbi:MAG TPA: methyltransferase domain-containing protein [Polyangiaceae bacterium]|nr:methyltransferase domain-containing protein [Polyangiaceae bacterium]
MTTSTTSRAPKSPMQQPETWSAIASGYAGAGKLFEVFQERALALLGDLRGKRVLDVACGPGALARSAAGRGAQVVATDFAPGMVEELRRLAAAEGLADAIDAHVMNAEALALENASFDAVFCLFGFMFFPDRARAFGELNRVLKPGGRAVILTWGPIERRPLMQIGFQAMGEALPDVSPPQKGDLQEPAECVAELSAAGFVDVSSEPVVGEARFESASHYAQVMEDTSGPLKLLRTRMGEEAWAGVRERFLAAASRRLPADGPFTLGAEALLTQGRKLG